MTWDPTPWFIGGGAQHSPEVARLLAYATSGGAEGVVEPADLKVSPLAVPGGSVRIAPGACLLRNRYPGGGQQSYVGRLAMQDTVPVTPTGSAGGRSDLVVARVLDPQYEGSAPSDPTDFDYVRTAVIEGVAASTIASAQAARAYCRTLGYPAIPLGGITLPASTGTVTAGMIRDLRAVALPREKRGQRMAFPTGNNTMPTTSYSSWPADVRTQVDIPEWATRALVLAHLSGIEVIGNGRTVAGVRTYLGPEIQPAGAQVGREIGENGILVDEGGTAARRPHLTVAGIHDVRWARGTTQWLMTQAQRTSGTATIEADYQTTISLEWTFVEEVD